MKFPNATTSALSIVLLAAASMSMLVNAEEPGKSSDDASTCGFYLAVSSTSTVEEPKWGIYSTKKLSKGDPILFGDVAINLFNLIGNQLRSYHHTDEEEERQSFLEQTVDFFEQYVWVPNSSGGQYELDTALGKTVTAVPGAGVLASFNPKLTNADWHHASAYFKEKWNDPTGMAHPGRGAYSNFYEATMKATEDVKAGMEIFVNYGDNWEEDESDDSELTHSDHVKVDKTVEKIVEFFDKHESELDQKSKMDIFNFLMKDVMAAAAGPGKGEVIREMLPKTPEELRQVPKTGGSLTWSQPASMRSVDWLAQYGRCMDNIKPGPSTVEYAGRGAFATRDIGDGDIVAPVPLVHIVDEEILNMHQTVLADGTDEDEWIRADDEVEGFQLAMNYCYGHPQSTMLLFPVGSAASFINHSKEPNAKLVWSKHPNHHQHWLEVPAYKLLQSENLFIGLMLEVVAVKPIKEGEEVFIDYGKEWQDAWDDHLSEWKRLQSEGEIPTQWPVRALDLNDEHRDGKKPFKTVTEGQDYPDNVMLKCFLVVKKPTDEPITNSAGQKVRLWVNGTESTTAFDSDNIFGCAVETRKTSENFKYEYDIIFRSQEDPTSVTLVKNVPHAAFTFVDKPGTGDQFEPSAFRHYIGIPDDVFPQGPWRDVINGRGIELDEDEDDEEEDEEEDEDDDDVHEEL